MAAPTPPVGERPRFALTLTVRNNAPTIGASLASLMPELDAGGELAIADAASTDGTLDEIRRAIGNDPRVHVRSEPCNRGEGRNRAVALTSAPIIVSQLDADNRYAPSVLRGAVAALERTPTAEVLNAIGLSDANPSSTRFFVWRRATLERLGGYPPSQVAEELGLILKAYRAGLHFRRFPVDAIAVDLKERHAGHGATRPWWQRGRVSIRAAKKFGLLGYRYAEFVRYLAMTRRTTPRFLAGLALSAVGYVSLAASGRDARFLDDGLGETSADVARAVATPGWPRTR